MSFIPSRFVIHEHKASRLHYDLRLEIDGVLKSWAIPKGPSLNPTDKRLAVMVPDHVLDYIDFEGVIPKGRYGAGPVAIWDTGDFIPIETDNPAAALKNGKLSFELNGKKLKGTFTLAQMKGLQRSTGKEWLLLKKKDAYADPNFVLQTELTSKKMKTLKKRTPPCQTE